MSSNSPEVPELPFPDARACLRLAARALEADAAGLEGYLPKQHRLYAALAEMLREKARTLDPAAERIARAVLESVFCLLRLLASPSNRTDYLLFGLAYRQPEWAEALKRRKKWIEEEAPGLRLPPADNDGDGPS